ncbi:MAG TPA: hypothetical protein VIM98_18095 [Dyella sp.]|uniref:hypothetical protein n=1 Tax=Dyella sp. TaxID=1869338 RepID=UPI002F928549
MVKKEISQLDSSDVDKLLVMCEEVMRATPTATHRFVEPAAGVLALAMAKQHHIVFGRRGSGKSSLLRKTVANLTLDRRPVAFVDLETFKGHTYPDVLIRVLISTLKSFAKWIDEAATTPASKTTFWDKLFGKKPTRQPFNKAATEKVRQELNGLVHELEKQLLEHEGSQKQLKETHSSESTDTAGGSAGIDVKGVKANLSASTSGKTAGSSELTSAYVHQKVEYLHQHIMKYKELFSSLSSLSSGPCFLVLDDLYHIRRADQAQVIDYFHRIVKGSDTWLKVGTIKHRSVWYIHGDPPIGMKENDDIKEINLDVSLEEFETLRRFLRKVLDDLMSDAKLRTSDVIGKGPIERLIIASGGVARDFIGILSKAISKARNKADSKRRKKLTTEDVNNGTGDYFPSKLAELKRDSADESEYLTAAFDHLRDFCLNDAKSNVFLVDQALEGSRRDAINQLVDLRLIHPVKSRVTLKAHSQGRLFEAYMLDKSVFRCAQSEGHQAGRSRPKQRSRCDAKVWPCVLRVRSS